MEVVSPFPSCMPLSIPPSPSRRRANSSAAPSSLLVRRTSKPDAISSLFTLSSPPSSPTRSVSRRRTSSALSLLGEAHPGTVSTSPSSNSLNAPFASPSISMSTATATGTVRAPRGALPLAFVPLTPIMASPIVTPGVSTSQEAREPGSLAVPATGLTDYLTRGDQAVVRASSESSHGCEEGDASETPTWTSTPPTPPSKLSISPARTRSRSRSRSRSARPASVAVPPAPCSPSAAVPPLPSSVSLSAMSSCGRHQQQSGRAYMRDRRRRMSLPLNLSKPQLQSPMTGSPTSSPLHEYSRLLERAASPLHSSVAAVAGTREGSIASSTRASSRKLFHLHAEEDASDVEDGEAAREREERKSKRYSLSRTVHPSEKGHSIERGRPGSAHSQMDTSPRNALEVDRVDEELCKAVAARTEADLERLHAATRRYHALMELLATEAGYLMDLRVLVTVYLEQLPTLAASSNSSALSLPALGLARSLPSSRSSFLHPSASAATPVSVGSQLQGRLGSDSGHGPPVEGEKEVKKEHMRQKSKERIKDKTKEKDGGKRKEKDKGHSGKDGTKEGSDEDAGADVLQEMDASVVSPLQDAQQLRWGSKEDAPPPAPHSHSSASKGKHARRPILAEKDVRTVCRNAKELLRFHDAFVRELQDAVGGYGLGQAFILDDEEKARVGGLDGLTVEGVDEVVAVVAEKFISQAPSFSIYETFCPGHNEVANLIRNFQECYPGEWDAYEQRCSLLVADFELSAVFGSSDDRPTPAGNSLPSSATMTVPMSPPLADSARKKRRHSTTSLSFLSSPPRTDAIPPMTHTRSDPSGRERVREGSSSSAHGHSRKFSQSQATRLKFLDYLIKPVQRICKYPLLLDQLKIKRPRAQSAIDTGTRPLAHVELGERIEVGSDIVERASEAMRLVVRLVNQASEIRTHIVRSALIASRMVFTVPPVSSASHHGHGHSHSFSSMGSSYRPKAHVLTPEFIASLGACHLAGALDVVQHPPLRTPGGGPLRAKYLGAFLYMGGYLVLVKIPKSGKIYEPRYWFSLTGFTVEDLEDDDSSLPFSFSLYGHGHHLQFAASCHMEKVIWLTAIQHALAVSAQWVNEPLESLPADDKLLPTPAAEEGAPEWTTNPLPTIQSLSEFEGQGDDPRSDAPTAQQGPLEKSAPMAILDSIALRQEQMQVASFAALNRRNSTASVKAFFSPMTHDSSTRVMRPSSQVRQQVDHGLHDVFSEECMAARSQAMLHEQDLFQPRKKPGAVMPRSSSALSISGAVAFASRRRRDSSGGRRKGSLDTFADQVDAEGSAKTLATLSGRGKAMSTRKSRKPLPSIVPAGTSILSKVESEVENDGPTARGSTVLLDSPFAASHCSSTASSNAESVLPSPVDAVEPLLESVDQDATLRPSDVLMVGVEDWRPKRTRSMVDNVKHFFHSRPASPSSSSGHTSPVPPQAVLQEPEAEPQSGFVQWWRKGSLRRRVQSSPDVPGDDAPSALPGRGLVDGHGGGSFLVQTLEDVSDEHSTSSPASAENRSPGDSRRVAFSETIPSRRRSLLSPSGRQHDSSLQQPSANISSPFSRKSLRSLFFQRSNSFTPADGKKR